ncbi:hypothetical protein EZS27_038283, partial [termite gut metagenome]
MLLETRPFQFFQFTVQGFKAKVQLLKL